MSFYTSLSGLQASQTQMATISHNIANVDTNGFKKSETEFADVIASSVSLSPTQMVGSGTVVKGNIQQFAQGNLVQSANSLDLAISGDGFFAVKPDMNGSTVDYTRNGGFQVDSDRYVVDGQGSHLQVYPVDGSGAVVATGLDSATSLRLPATSGAAQATSAVSMSANLNANSTPPTATTFNRFDPSTYNQSTQTTVYDADGNPETLTSYFRRDTATSMGSQWSVFSFVGDQQLTSGGGTSDHQTLTFDSSGNLSPAAAQTTSFDAFTTANSTAQQQFSFTFGADTTQTSQPFNVAARNQDGKAVGQLQGVTIDEKGLVQASFSNGDTQAIGQVVMASFTNPSGLRQLGDSYWASTGVSGDAKLGSAGSGGFGNIMSGTIERSNVDITEELVALISAQQNFQANAKALDTANQISQTIFNIHS